MGNLSFKEQLKQMSREQLTALRDKTIEEIFPPYIRNWSFQAQNGHISAFVRKAIQIERALNGEEASQKLKAELYKRVPKFRALTAEEKEVKYLNYDMAALESPSGYKRAVSNWYARKMKSMFNPSNGRERGSSDY